MSNQVKIQAIRFVKPPIPDGRQDWENYKQNKIDNYGITFRDNYIQGFVDNWNSIPDNDMDILRKAVKEIKQTDFISMMNYCWENSTGLCINETWYDWDEIKEIVRSGRTQRNCQPWLAPRFVPH